MMDFGIPIGSELYIGILFLHLFFPVKTRMYGKVRGGRRSLFQMLNYDINRSFL